MGLCAAFYGLIHKNKNSDDKRAHYIFYKIVDFTSEEFVLQCINTKAIFCLKITEIVFDIDILHGLHPTQACYIGMEYSKHLKKTDIPTSLKNKNHKLEPHSAFRYGKYNLRYQNRNGDLCFTCEKTNQEFIMDPRDIALSEALIAEFDAAQAFYIGLLVGLKLNNKVEKIKIPQESKKPHFWIVK